MGSIPIVSTTVMSRDIGNARTHGSGVSRWVLGLVAAGWVEGEVAEELAGGGVDDADVEVVDEDDDGLSGVGAADADVVHLAGSAEGDGAVGVDAVVSEPVVGSCGW
ncbi:MAG TPA: hypothetical protein VGE43_16815, partial [Acidimicrobiales bacterium]